MGLLWAHVVVGSVQFLECCQMQGLNFLLVVGWRLLSHPCHMGFSMVVAQNMVADFPKASQSLILARQVYTLI